MKTKQTEAIIRVTALSPHRLEYIDKTDLELKQTHIDCMRRRVCEFMPTWGCISLTNNESLTSPLPPLTTLNTPLNATLDSQHLMISFLDTYYRAFSDKSIVQLWSNNYCYYWTHVPNNVTHSINLSRWNSWICLKYINTNALYLRRV